MMALGNNENKIWCVHDYSIESVAMPINGPELADTLSDVLTFELAIALYKKLFPARRIQLKVSIPFTQKVLALSLLMLSSFVWASDSEPLNLSKGLASAASAQLGIEVDVLTAEALTAVTELTVNDAGHLDLSGIEQMTNLSRLELQRNFISDISPLSALTQLNHLDLSDNRISEVEALRPLSNLTYLNLNNNLIIHCIAIGALTELRALRLNANAIEDLSPLETLPNLVWLHVSENRLTDLDGIQSCETLGEVLAARNSVVDISALTTLTGLESLDLSDNRLESIDALSGLLALETLELRKNPIRSLDALANLTQLKRLYISSPRLDGNVAPLGRLTNLVELHCTQSHIQNVEPLKTLNRLELLDLRDNDIRDIQPLLDSRAPFKIINLTGNRLGRKARSSQITTLSKKATVSFDGRLYNAPNSLFSRFADIDQDQDKTWSYQEASAFVADLHRDEFDALDTNRDWAISADELADLMVILPDSMDLVWVGKGTSSVVLGTRESPFDSIEKATEAVKKGGTIVVTPGTILSGTTLSKPLTLKVPEGSAQPVRIGDNGAPEKP